MNKATFCLRGLRTNVRRVPLAVASLVLVSAVAFMWECWVLRMVYGEPEIRPADLQMIKRMSVLVVVVCLMYMLFMHGYYLKISSGHNVPYRRMGAPEWLLVLNSFIEIMVIYAVGVALGSAFDSLVYFIAPQEYGVRYLDGGLFGIAAGVVAIAPAISFVLNMIKAPAVRLFKYLIGKILDKRKEIRNRK